MLRHVQQSLIMLVAGTFPLMAQNNSPAGHTMDRVPAEDRASAEPSTGAGPSAPIVNANETAIASGDGPKQESVNPGYAYRAAYLYSDGKVLREAAQQLGGNFAVRWVAYNEPEMTVLKEDKATGGIIKSKGRHYGVQLVWPYAASGDDAAQKNTAFSRSLLTGLSGDKRPVIIDPSGGVHAPAHPAPEVCVDAIWFMYLLSDEIAGQTNALVLPWGRFDLSPLPPK